MSLRGGLALACCAGWLATAGSARAAEPLRFDGRDRYTLLDRHLQTRQLRLQLEQPGQGFRLARDWEPFRAAGDVSIGTQQTYKQGTQTHFHGFAIADTFLGLRILPGLDVTLNLLAFNPSASDGYRVSAVVKPAVALDAEADLFRIAGEPLHLGVSGTDLGFVTLGEGLLFEQMQLEGVVGWLDYGPATLSYLYGGRALWEDDDLIRTELGLFGRRLRFMFVEWQSKLALIDAGGPFRISNLTPDGKTARYADVALDLPLAHGFRSAFEYALRLRDTPTHGALLRLDYLQRDLGPLDVHAGYQFRFYQRGFGPRNLPVAPTVPFSFPYQEDVYVTNPYEYLGISEGFEQWSHTLMLEARLELTRGIELFAFEELWERRATAFGRVTTAANTWAGWQAPDHRLGHYYSAGLSYYPWRGLPHRADAFVTNKQVPGSTGQLALQRFVPGRYYVLRFRAQF